MLSGLAVDHEAKNPRPGHIGFDFRIRSPARPDSSLDASALLSFRMTLAALVGALRATIDVPKPGDWRQRPCPLQRKGRALLSAFTSDGVEFVSCAHEIVLREVGFDLLAFSDHQS